MHEINIVRQIIERVGGKKVNKITIEVGELIDHSAEDIKESLEQMSGWEVEVVKAESLVECVCGYRGEPKILEKSHGVILFTCPECEKRPRVLKGDSVKILKVE